MLDFNEEEFDRVRNQAEERYRAFGKIRCPYFQENVAFNAAGFSHLLFKSWNRSRSRRDQFMRLKYLTMAPEILGLSRPVQGIQEANEWERRHKHGQWVKLLTRVIYYEFVAVLNDRRFKVIVKQLPGGERIFWSLIPFWGQTQEGRRLLHDGQPADD